VQLNAVLSGTVNHGREKQESRRFAHEPEQPQMFGIAEPGTVQLYQTGSANMAI